MIQVLSRRLRVRDDGTGKARDTVGTFADFATEDAIILLGDPGMGKTTFFKEAANSTYTTVRKFLVDPLATTSEVIFLMPSMNTELLQAGKMPAPKSQKRYAL